VGLTDGADRPAHCKFANVVMPCDCPTYQFVSALWAASRSRYLCP
jgi:hypothetical protein